MMAEKEMRNQFRSAITAAAVCCRMPVSDETSSITQYLKSLLDTALDGAGLYADVMPLPYQPCSKLPVVIALDGKNPRLLWYYKGMSAPALADELYWLFCDCLLYTSPSPRDS